MRKARRKWAAAADVLDSAKRIAGLDETSTSKPAGAFKTKKEAKQRQTSRSAYGRIMAAPGERVPCACCGFSFRAHQVAWRHSDLPHPASKRVAARETDAEDRKSTRLNSSHSQ